MSSFSTQKSGYSTNHRNGSGLGFPRALHIVSQFLEWRIQ